MGFSIENLSVSGFRGVNSEIQVGLQTGVTLLFGANGSGKTSVLQAVEWVLTGSLPYMTGQDFFREDAVVNVFNPERNCVVKLELTDGINKTVCLRWRKMGKSTSRRSSSLSATFDGTSLKGSEAQTAIEKLLGVPISDFSKVAFLHQESIRELISVDPKERSRAIDRLLGTFEVRELSEALDVRRAVATKESQLVERMENLTRDKVQFTISMRARLNKYKDNVKAAGYDESELSAEGLSRTIANLAETTNRLVRKYNAQLLHVGASSAKEHGARSALASIESTVKLLDRHRLKTVGELEKRKAEITNASRDLALAIQEFDSLGTTNMEELVAQKKEVSEEVKRLDAVLASLSQTLGSVVVLESKFTSTRKRIEDLQASTTRIIAKYGDKSRVTNAKVKYGEEIAALRAAAESFSLLIQLLSLALEYVNSVGPEYCPVCGQAIVPAKLQVELKGKASSEASARLNAMISTRKELESKLEGVKQDEIELQTSERMGESEKKRLDELLVDVSKVMNENATVGFDFASRIEIIKNQMQSLNGHTVTQRTKLNELEERDLRLRKASQKLRSAERNLQSPLDSESLGTTLLAEAASALSKTEETLKVYGESVEIDELLAHIQRVQVVVGYQDNVEESEALEKELPKVSELIGRLERSRGEISKLAGSLGAIRQAALAYGEETVTSELTSLGELISSYFSRMLGHPTFGGIRLVVEKREPLIYSVRAEGALATTYIPTRFSTAQMNSVAISLFLASNEKMQSNFETIMIDDPTQGMDSAHKEALASIVSSLGEAKQVLIASQDEDFREALSRYCGRFTVLEFGQWSADGPSISKSDENQKQIVIDEETSQSHF